MKKKVLTLFLAICLAAGNAAIPEAVSATEVETGQVNASDWEWEEQEGGGVSVTAYKGTETEVTIPGTLDGKTVTAIGAGAFSSQGEGGGTVTKVTIPDSVTAIGDSAFSGCENLEEVNIPSGVTKISYSTFSLCFKLKNVTLPSGVTTIGDSAFFACQSLESIALPENLATIGEGAFAGCSGTGEDDVVTGLGSIMIPASVTFIGKNAFAENENLKQITVAEGNDNYASVEGVLFNQAKTELIAYPAGREGKKYEVPSGVQKIGDGAFYGVHTLSEVTFSSTLREIGEDSFCLTALQAVVLPDSLQKIGRCAFSNSDLTVITIPSGVTVIGEEAFQGCYDFAAVNVDASNTVYASADGVLYNKAKTELLYYPGAKEILSYVIPDSVTTIGRNAFQDARFSSIVVPAYVAKIKMGAFYCNSLEQITILNPQCEIGETDEGGEPMAGTVISLDAIIRGYEGSTAQAYAQQNENPFEVISEEACTHEYVEQVTTPATCQQKGVKTFTCKKCGDSYTEEIPMISHTYGEAVIVQSTCTKAGTKTYTCSVCGHSESEELPLAEHMYKTETQKAASGKDGSIQTKCSVCGEVSAKQAISAPQVVSLSKSTVTYNGKAQSVVVTVKDSAGKVIPAANYSVAYSNNKNVGEASVTVTFKGNYTGSIKSAFCILPKGTSLSKVSAKTKGFTVKWKKQAVETTGYELQYSTSSKFKGAKTAKNIKAKATSKKVTKLKAKKKYYVRIRTYKTAKVNGKNTKLYSGWSKAKTVTTKR